MTKPTIASPISTTNVPWKPKKDHYKQALMHIADRKAGKIKSLKCSSPKMNSAFADGFEFHTAVCFAARPSVGKSLWKEQLVREFFNLNPDIKFRVMDFDLEMLPMITAMREFTSVLDKPYKYLISAEDDGFGQKMTKEEFDFLKNYVAGKVGTKDQPKEYPIDVVSDAPTVNQFVEYVEMYMEQHSYVNEKGEKCYTNTVIPVDHVRLFKKAGSGEVEMLYEFAEAVIYLKKKYPILFLLFIHINRRVTEASRCEPGKLSNYLVDDDIHGADALSQACDIVVTIDCPAKRQIDFYGPSNFIIGGDPSILVYRFLKVRNGELLLAFYRAEYSKMTISEMDPPPMGRNNSKRRE